jgi:hypothetical protein
VLLKLSLDAGASGVGSSNALAFCDEGWRMETLRRIEAEVVELKSQASGG